MSNRNRNIYIAFGLVLLILATVLTFRSYKSFIEYQNQHTEERQSVSNYKAETNEQYSDNCLNEPISISAAFKCLIGSVDSNREAQRSKFDLHTQQEMAEWSFAIFLLTLAGLIVSFLGLTALFISLYQTRTVIKDNREIGEAQTRAYLKASGGSYRIEGDEICFQAKFKNTGNSPAKRVTTKTRVGIVLVTRTKNQEPTRWHSVDFEGNCDDVASDSEDSGFARVSTDKFTPDLIKRLHTAERSYLEGEVTWFDVFNKSQTIWFAYVCRKGEVIHSDGKKYILGKLQVVMNKDERAAQG